MGLWLSGGGGAKSFSRQIQLFVVGFGWGSKKFGSQQMHQLKYHGCVVYNWKFSRFQAKLVPKMDIFKIYTEKLMKNVPD